MNKFEVIFKHFNPVIINADFYNSEDTIFEFYIREVKEKSVFGIITYEEVKYHRVATVKRNDVLYIRELDSLTPENQ